MWCDRQMEDIFVVPSIPAGMAPKCVCSFHASPLFSINFTSCVNRPVDQNGLMARLIDQVAAVGFNEFHNANCEPFSIYG